MAGKPKLHYFNGRGRMESIRWLLAAAGVEFEENFLESAEDLDRLRNDGSLMFQQMTMVEIDGMKLVQTRAILNYIASKYNLYGKDLKERDLINMYIEGMANLYEMIMLLPLIPPDQKDAKVALIKERTTNRYFPQQCLGIEKSLDLWTCPVRPQWWESEAGEVPGRSRALPDYACVHHLTPRILQVLKSHGQDYLVGNRLSRADIQLVELLYEVEEFDPSLIASFPLLKALKTRISNLPAVKKFLQPGSQRKPPTNMKTFEETRKIFRF
ncbi:glutathione S-transferase A3-like [Carlito syrichta]|uniref:glutathione transferase n=1 Tax=Carlito syrichta TaxID=1868482 RepID=A0A1U7TDH5_CARSF|nr:glutathione S-transferase A3-like [Carlito syrichta]